MRLMGETMSSIGLMLCPAPAMASQETPRPSPGTEGTGSSTWSDAVKEQLHREMGPAIKKPVPETTVPTAPATGEEYPPSEQEESAGSEKAPREEGLPELTATGEEQPATEEEPPPATGDASPAEEQAKPPEGEAAATPAETWLTVEEPSTAVTHDTAGTDTIPPEPQTESEPKPEPGPRTESSPKTEPGEPMAGSQGEAVLHEDDPEEEIVIFTATPQSTRHEAKARAAKTRVLALLNEKIFVYDPQNMIDPFESFLTQPQPSPFQFVEEMDARPEQRRPLTPLMRMSITEVQNGLKAIVWGEMGRRAVIEDPTGRGYIVNQGTEIANNHGFISEIFNDSLVITQTIWDDRERRSRPVNTVIRLNKE